MWLESGFSTWTRRRKEGEVFRSEATFGRSLDIFGAGANPFFC
jgi:hypothetical protein